MFQNIFTTFFDIADQARVGLLALFNNGPEEGKGGLIGSHLYQILENEENYLLGALSCMIKNV